MRKYGIIGIVLIIIAILIFYYLQPFEKDTNSDNEEIKIGVILPLTGPAAEIGNSILNGINIAFDDLEMPNTTIKLIIEDDKLDPKTGINAANKLISIDKVKVIIGLASSNVALAVAPICEKNNVIMLSSTASTPKLTNSGKFVFRIYPSDIYDGKILAEFAFNELYAKSASVLYLNNDFGLGLRNSFDDNFKKLGGKILTNESFLAEDNNFKTQLTSIKKSRSDVLLAVSIDRQYENIIRQIRELSINSKILAPVTFDNPKIIENLGGSANGVYYTRPQYNISSSKAIAMNFRKLFNNIHNTDPSLLNALGYDSFYVIFQSLINNDNDFLKLAKYIGSTNFEGASGNFRFDANGDVIREIEIMKIENNKIIKYVREK